MPRKLPEADRKNAVKLYVSGLSGKQVALQLGVSGHCIERYLNEAGVTRSIAEAQLLRNARGDGRKPIELPLEDIKRRYEAGEGCPQIAQTYGVSQSVISRRLQDMGVRIRTLAEAGALIREESRAKRAESCAAPVGWGEELLGRWLRERGKDPVHQLPVGSRNVDLALTPIAVEVWLSGSSPLTDPYCRNRIKYLGDRGWSSCYVFIPRRTRILVPAVADQIVALHDAALLNPTAPRQHWVIRGCGELAATFGDDLNHGPLIPMSVSCPYHGSGNSRFAR
jgi:transposase